MTKAGAPMKKSSAQRRTNKSTKKTDSTPLPPSFMETVRLTVGLRFRLFSRQFTRRGILGAVVSGILALALSMGLGIGTFFVFRRVLSLQLDPAWIPFLLSLFTFLLGLFWTIWPVVAAQVDEGHELGRFFPYPVSPRRLYLIQTAASLLEPSVLFFYPPLVGVAAALALSPETPMAITLIAMGCFVIMVVASGQMLRNFFLNVMKSRRSGEILFAALLALLGLSVFLPPVDASWLLARVEGFGGAPEDLTFLIKTARSLKNTPPGWLASAILLARAGRPLAALAPAVAMLGVGVVAWFLGLSLLLRFYRGAGGGVSFSKGAEKKPSHRPDVPRRPRLRRTPLMEKRLPLIDGATAAVFVKELRSLVANPKARLLLVVPFFLVIVLKIIGAPQLFFFLWDDAWSAVFMGFLSLYVLSVLSGQLFANGFGFDGHGIRQVFFYPVGPGTWFRGRNLAQAAVTSCQYGLLWVLVLGSMEGATLRGSGLPMSGFAFTLPVLLGLGNVLSIRYPRRFYYTLAHRDRPVATSFLLVLLALAACAAVSMAAFALHTHLLGSVGGPLVPGIALLSLGLVVYRGLTRWASGRFPQERERLLHAVAR